MTPRVTVLMPVFNREAYVSEAIESVLAQSVADFEFVIVDDASTDGTAEILAQWAVRDTRIRLLTAPRNLGIAEAPNLGLRAARAAFVARLDSDDVMSPGRLASQLAVLESQSDVVLVSSAYEVMDQSGRTLGVWSAQEPHEVVRFFLRFTNIVGGGGHVTFRRAAVLALDGYDARYPSSEDYDLWVRLLERGRIVTLPDIGMRQREHPGRATFHFAAQKRANWNAIMGRSLSAFLRRTVSQRELSALITLWRLDGIVGVSGIAERILREAFHRFCSDHPQTALRARVRRRIAAQWLLAASRYAADGESGEAMHCRALAAHWSPSTAWDALRGLLRPAR